MTCLAAFNISALDQHLLRQLEAYRLSPLGDIRVP